jgi:hypothetical protein
MRSHLFAAAVVATLAGPAFAQAAAPAGPSQVINTHLPIPAIDENAPPSAFLHAARDALGAGRVGEAQEALERAETRALDRSVRPSRANTPSGQTLVQQINNARAALGTGDRTATVAAIDTALANPDADATPQ